MSAFWISGALFGLAVITFAIAVLPTRLAPHIRTRCALSAGVLLVLAAIATELGRQDFELMSRKQRIGEIQVALADLQQQMALQKVAGGDVARLSQIAGEMASGRRELGRLQRR